MLLCVGEVVGLVVVLICEVFWLKTKGWKVCWFGVVLCWCCVFVVGFWLKTKGWKVCWFVKVWCWFVFYAMAASVWTVWLWMTGLKSVPAASAGVFTVMLPISAALVGVFVLGETLTGIQLLAFSIALLGVLLATLPSGRTVTPAP